MPVLIRHWLRVPDGFAKPLTQHFSGFVRSHRAGAHFRRAPMPGVPEAGAGPAVPGRLDAALLRAAHESPAATLARLGSGEQGLTAAEAARRLARDGPNLPAHDRPLPAWRRLWQCYRDPFNLLLTVLASLSWLSADARAAVVVLSMVGLSTLLRFVQESRSSQATEQLRARIGNTATVMRASAAGGQAERHDVPVVDIVAGDLIALSAGDMIPADCRILEAHDLFVAQAAMTGESAPVEKFAWPATADDNPLDQATLAFMGTNVVSGAATAVVLATGPRTWFGMLAARSAAPVSEPNAFQAGVDSVSWLLIRFGAVMVPVVFLINGATKGNWLEAFLFAVSVAVGLTPEMLPMIVTSTLARGAVQLARKKVVVKRLDAIQNLGAMDVLCTDKTGTLTQDRIAVARMTDAFGRASGEVAELAFLNSHYQTGLKNLLDHAVLAQRESASARQLARDYRKIGEIPFDFVRRRMSVIVATGDDRHILICKGAFDEVLSACTRVRHAPADAPLDSDVLLQVRRYNAELGNDGLRVVALAIRTLPAAQSRYAVADETGLTLVGLVAFVDPPRESAAPALAALARHGVRVTVLSGDNEFVMRHVCVQVGLPAQAPVLGQDIEKMDAAALQLTVERHGLFARLTPFHKERIVHALRASGHVVGFLGDGINDAPALRAADVGVSVDTAVDIAKEAADIILLEKSLLVLDDGVMEGRTTFCNMLKYIRMTASSNFGNVLSVLVASAALPFLPMLPLQLLVQNLLYDFGQTAIPFDRVDAELVQAPLAWHPRDIGRFMLHFGPISSMFDLATFAVMWWVFDANEPGRQALFQSGWFVVGLLTQTLVVHLIRTPGLPFVHSRAAAPVLVMTACIVMVGLWLPAGPLAGTFRLQPLPPAYFGWLAAILAGYFLLTTAMKHWYVRRYGWQ